VTTSITVANGKATFSIGIVVDEGASSKTFYLVLDNPTNADLTDPSIVYSQEYLGTIPARATTKNGETVGAHNTDHGAHNAKLALLTNYMAGSFAAASGQGGAASAVEPAASDRQLLSHPHA